MLNKSIVAILEKYICNIDFASKYLLYVNENDEIDINNGMTRFRGKVRNTGEGEQGVCMRGANGGCTRASRIASLSMGAKGERRMKGTLRES